MTGVQEFQITTDEAHKVAEAAVNVSRHYDVEASEKAMDWTNLILALAMVYGTRLFAFTQRRQRETPSEKKAGNSSAFIPGVGPMPLTH